MIDQYHLRQQVHSAQNALRLLGLSTEDVNWRQYAIMLLFSPRLDRLQHRLVNKGRGWFRHQQGAGYATSLYLSPKGQPFYVGYADHCTLTGDLMGLSQHGMDMAGWLHISNGRVDCPVGVTTAQRDWLKANPPSFGEWNIRDKEYPQRVERYEAAEKWDVRPSDEDDRFYMRLFQQYTVPITITVSHGVQSCA